MGWGGGGGAGGNNALCSFVNLAMEQVYHFGFRRQVRLQLLNRRHLFLKGALQKVILLL